jgi:hypothetical protein
MVEVMELLMVVIFRVAASGADKVVVRTTIARVIAIATSFSAAAPK